MGKRPAKRNTSMTINQNHLVLSTGEAHPPFIQEVAPGEIERCVWDPGINGYRCTIIPSDNGA